LRLYEDSSKVAIRRASADDARMAEIRRELEKYRSEAHSRPASANQPGRGSAGRSTVSARRSRKGLSALSTDRRLQDQAAMPVAARARPRASTSKQAASGLGPDWRRRAGVPSLQLRNFVTRSEKRQFMRKRCFSLRQKAVTFASRTQCDRMVLPTEIVFSGGKR
jgi:hypothetical protein